MATPAPGASASSIADIRLALKELEDQCRAKVNSDNSGTLLQRLHKWSKPENYYEELSNSLFDNIRQLDTYWTLFDPVYKWAQSVNPREAGRFLCVPGEVERIASVTREVERIAKDLGVAKDRYSLQSKKHLKFLKEVLREYQIRTDNLMSGEITVYSRSSCSRFLHSFRVPPPDRLKGDDCFDVNELLDSALVSLQVIVKQNDAADGPLSNQICALYDDLKCIHGCIGGIFQDYISSKCVCYYAGIENFLFVVVCVAVDTVLQSFNYCINKKNNSLQAKSKLIAGIEHLQRQIVKLNLQFLKNVDDLRNIQPGDSCHYLTDEVKSLVIHFILHSPTAYDDGFRSSLVAEIKAVVDEAASLLGAETDTPPCSETLIKICLLKVELFLLVHLDNRTSCSSVSCKINEVDEFLGKLRRFSKDLPQQKIDYGKQTLALIQEIASLYQSYHKAAVEVRVSLPGLLYKIVIFKAESFLMDLLVNNATLMATAKDQIESLLEELRFFKEFLTIQLRNNTDILDNMFQQIEAGVRGITFFSYSFSPKDITELRLKEMMISFAELFDQLKHIKAKHRETCPQFPIPNIPKTCNLLFIEFLIRNIGEILKNDAKSIRPVKVHMTEIQHHLESLKSFLMKVSELERPELKDLGNDVIRVVYKVDHAIDLIELGAGWINFFWLIDMLHELRFVTKQASSIQMISLNAKIKSIIQVSHARISRDNTREAVHDMVVNLRDQEEVIIDRLTRGSTRRDTVSIVGTPGIGKTALARQVYNSQHITYHFHRRAWCTVSQVYDKRELLLEILSNIHGLTDEIHGMSDAELEEKLRRCLLRNKYLIVMDDLWDVGAWNDLQISLPDDSNGSRILITTRLCDVLLEIMPNSDPHHLRPFSDDESWKLLEMKIFQGESCPEELLLVGKEIARQCKGLPLAVVAISGLLKRTEKRKDWWETIAESLSSQIISDPEARCMEIFELSYRNLPENLKACFLYFGAFFEDRDISVTKLIRFWLAEGFIWKTDSRSLEVVAEDHLMDLINRSLVIISERGSNGKVKTCRIHDLIRDFCQSKANEENFLKLITRSDEPYASFPSSDNGFGFEFDHHFDAITYQAYRLSIFLRRNHFVISRPSGLGTRSLIFFASADSEPRCPYDISFICRNFKFLRVLDLECINMGMSFPAEIGLLVQLRYLAVSGYVHNVPRSISSLQRLETLVVKGFHGKVILPDTIWRMSSLRHLHVNKYVAFNLQNEEFGSSFQLENLISFSFPALSYGKETEKILKRLPNLHKLRCIFLESWDSSKNCNLFSILNFLPVLESLKIFYFGKALSPSELILPLSLKKLTLSHFRLPWSHISAIGRLPNLEVLKLDSGAFEGRSWEMSEGEFQELKFLKLDTLNIAEWKASSDHLPKLERLVLQNCKDLQEIPCEFVEICTLELIEVHWCRQSAELCAKRIGEENEEIKVLISHS